MANCKYWNVNYLTFQWFIIGLFCNTKNVNTHSKILVATSINEEPVLSKHVFISLTRAPQAGQNTPVAQYYSLTVWPLSGGG